jgi:hypothetical protein
MGNAGHWATGVAACYLQTKLIFSGMDPAQAFAIR